MLFSLIDEELFMEGRVEIGKLRLILDCWSIFFILDTSLNFYEYYRDNYEVEKEEIFLYFKVLVVNKNNNLYLFWVCCVS